MPTFVESTIMPRSQKIYERLLALYPRAYRDEYGLPMVQLFRDQARDAQRERGAWGIAVLWLRVLPDLLKTSFIERLSSLKGKKSMADKISEVTGPVGAPWKTFFRVGVVVFLLVFISAVLITFILPETFASATRIKVEPDARAAKGQNVSPGALNGSNYDPYFIQTEFEVIQSEMVLSRAIQSLDLNTDWGKKYAGGNKLKTSETLALLKARMDLRPVRNTSLIEIRVYSESPAEAANIANAVADAYKNFRHEQRYQQVTGGVKALRSQLDEQDAKVHDAQVQVDKLRRELRISATESSAVTAVVDADSARRLQGELISLETMLIKDETVLRKLRELNPDQRRDAIQTTVGPDEALNKLLTELSAAQQTLVSMKKDHAPTHPNYISAQALADNALKQTNDRVEGIMLGLANRVSGLKATVETMQAKIDESRRVDIDRVEQTHSYYEAKARLGDLERFRSVLSTKLASEQVDASMPVSTLVEIVDRAEPGMRPVRPNKPLNIFLGACWGMLLALIFGGGAAWLTVLFRRRSKPVSHS